MRIGVNWGSLDQDLLATLMDENALRAQPWEARQVMYEALITSALDSARAAEELGLAPGQITLSCKVSGVQDLIAVYQELARRCNYSLHLGLTEAGMGTKGTVASALARHFDIPYLDTGLLYRAVGVAASRISSPVGNDCQKSFTLMARPPLTSPTNARPDARRPASAKTQVLCALVRL